MSVNYNFCLLGSHSEAKMIPTKSEFNFLFGSDSDVDIPTPKKSPRVDAP